MLTKLNLIILVLGVGELDELRSVLELATEEELRQLTELLFRPKFNPLDYVNAEQVIEIQSRSRGEWLEAIESRFRFLAADGMTVLRRQANQITYRQALIQVCHYLKVPYSKSQLTTEIESEIFLHLLEKAWKKMPKRERQALNSRVSRSITESSNLPALGVATPAIAAISADPINSLIKNTSILALSSVVKSALLQQVAQQFALHFATHQVAQSAVLKGGIAAATQWESYVALQTAKRGMALTAARYGAVRTVFAMISPALWGYFVADLGWKAIATNYGRIIPAIFALAQIRLTRGEDWQIVY